MQGWRRRLTALAACPLLCTAGMSASADNEGLVDPTRPQVVVATPPATRPSVLPRHRLQSVLIGPGRRLAVVDGELLAEGETTAGYELLKVLEDRVTLRLADGRQQVLHLAIEELRKDAPSP